jgi:triosephosphate isomerase (TIM)
LKSVGAKFVIIGHSERRKLYNEKNDLLAKKTVKVLEQDLTPIYCCGETLEQREKKEQNKVVGEQIKTGLFNIEKEKFGKVIIAYEPVWAIGTGKNATPEQAQEMHKFIRSEIEKKYDKETAENTHILYGGSVKPDNAKELLSQPDIDGALVGGASLKAEDFYKIATAI